MRPPGSFKITRSARSLERPLGLRTAAPRASFDDYVEAVAFRGMRVRRIVDSLRREIADGDPSRCLRIRQVFDTPREIFRVELDVPGLCYQRTTLLDRDALEELLEADEVREALSATPDSGSPEKDEVAVARPSVRHA